MKKENTDKQVVLYYLNNIVKNRTRYLIDNTIDGEICTWFERNSKWLIGRELTSTWVENWYYWVDVRKKGMSDEQYEKSPASQRCCDTIQKWLKGNVSEICKLPEAAVMMEAFHLSPQCYNLMLSYVYRERIPILDSLFCCGSWPVYRLRIQGAALNLAPIVFKAIFSRNGELLSKGIFARQLDEKVPSTLLYDVLSARCKTVDSIKRIVLGKAEKAILKPERFTHVLEEYNWLKNMLISSLAKKQRGVNILIYGKPGTGKTEMIRTLCKEIGVSLFAISNKYVDEQNGHGRRNNLSAAISLLKGDNKSVLLMDEAEDVFGAHTISFLGFHTYNGNDIKSKMFFHRLLESNEVPVIWICNNINGVDPAHIRRFSYTMEMTVPDESVQTQIWRYSARKNKIRLSKDKVNALVQKYDIEPSVTP